MGMLAGASKIHGIIDEQINKGIPSERIILGGFSQGGSLALLVLSPSLSLSLSVCCVLTERLLRLVLHAGTNSVG